MRILISAGALSLCVLFVNCSFQPKHSLRHCVCTVHSPLHGDRKVQANRETTNKHTVWKVVTVLDLKNIRLGANRVDLFTLVRGTSV